MLYLRPAKVVDAPVVAEEFEEPFQDTKIADDHDLFCVGDPMDIHTFFVRRLSWQARICALGDDEPDGS